MNVSREQFASICRNTGLRWVRLTPHQIDELYATAQDNMKSLSPAEGAYRSALAIVRIKENLAEAQPA